MIAHLLNRVIDVYRQIHEPDGSGGQTTAWVLVAAGVPARIAQPTTAERVVADMAGAELSARVYLAPGAEVRRGDQLRDEAAREIYRVKATIYPSGAAYLRADCERDQWEPPNG